jgi:hypothetical protein
MPHGQRDWSNIGADETVHSFNDMAELAVRLGSPVTFNREGNVLFMETWDHGITPWVNTVSGAGAEVIASNGWSKIGPYSCKLVCGSDTGKLAQVNRYWPYPVLGKYGVEVSVGFNVHLSVFKVKLYLYDGTDLYQYEVWYDQDNSLVKIRTSSGYQNVITDLALAVQGQNTFHIVKLVVDLSIGYYSRVIINETETNLEAYDVASSASATSPQLMAWFEAIGTAGQTGYAYVDDIIITQNEP